VPLLLSSADDGFDGIRALLKSSGTPAE
jgi:hypothetical protein